MQRYSKRIVLLALIAVLALSLVACGNNPSIVPAEADGSMVEIYGLCTAEVADDKVVVTVDTDLSDNIFYTLSVTNESGEVLAEVEQYKQSGVDPTASFTIMPEWPDVVYGFLVAKPGDNDSEGIEKSYGKDFSRITYENMVYQNKKNLIVFGSEPLTIR